MAYWATIKGKQKPVEVVREVARGKNKGKLVVRYLAGYTRACDKIYRNAIIEPGSLEVIEAKMEAVC